MRIILKSVREQANVSRSELAKETGVSVQAVDKWERGESYPRADKLPEIAKALNCSIDELFEREG